MSNEFEHNSDVAVDFKRLLSILQQWARLLILAVALGAAAAYAYSSQQTPVYEATTNILVTRNPQPTVGDLTQSLDLSQLLTTYVRMLSLDEFLSIVSQRVGYKVDSENVNVTALTNTQVIQLKVQDANPSRATQIADTMVKVLREQNETLQAGRYAQAEQSLDMQIKDIETQIADVQSKLDAAKTSALVQQTTEAQANIDNTVNAIKVTSTELNRLHKMSWVDAHFQLIERKNLLPQQQALLDKQIAEKNFLQEKLSTDSQVQTNAKYAQEIQAQIADASAKIETARQLIEEAQNDIAFLTPLDTEQGFNSTVVEKENLLKTQESLLTSYQNVYTSLLSTEEVKRTTNEIDNLTQNLNLYQNIYLNLLSSRETVKNQEMQNIPTIEQVSLAQASAKPVRPRTLLNTLLGAATGLILALSFVSLREMMDDTIKSREEIEELMGTKVIGYITNIKENHDSKGIFVGRAPRLPVTEAFRVLRTNLEFSSKEKPVRSIIVTSGGPADGKTTVAANLAAILALSGKKAILVDADLRCPQVHLYAGVSNTLGLSDLLNIEHANINDYIQKLENIPGLSILPSGNLPPNPTDQLGSERMKDILKALSDSYDYVVVDCSPMLVADPQMLLGLADGLLLVLVPGQTHKEVVRAIKEQIQQTNARLLGVVFNRLQSSRRSRYGGYSYYSYPYYYSSNYYSSNGLDGKSARRKIGLKKADEDKSKSANTELAGIKKF